MTKKPLKKIKKEVTYYEQFPITDIHDFSYRGTKKKNREKLGIGDIYLNGAICLDCNYFIRSRNRHDFVTCKCGNVSVDGGSFYAKRNFRNTNFKDIIEFYEDAKKQ